MEEQPISIASFCYSQPNSLSVVPHPRLRKMLTLMRLCDNQTIIQKNLDNNLWVIFGPEDSNDIEKQAGSFACLFLRMMLAHREIALTLKILPPDKTLQDLLAEMEECLLAPAERMLTKPNSGYGTFQKLSAMDVINNLLESTLLKPYQETPLATYHYTPPETRCCVML